MSTDRDRIDAAIQALDAQRALLGHAIVDTALAPLRARRADLRSNAPAAAPATAPATAPPERLLKQVTVLFLDAVGCTTLGPHLDPEDIQHTMDGLLARCTAAAQRQHGKVLPYAADSRLAAFGTGGLVEEDPGRGVRGGLELRAEGRARGHLHRQRAAGRRRR